MVVYQPQPAPEPAPAPAPAPLLVRDANLRRALDEIAQRGEDIRRMTTLDLRGKKIQDITSLSELTQLTTLYLRGNQISPDDPTVAELRQRGVDVYGV